MSTRLGGFDAVTGQGDFRLALGPHLPGRIPAGFLLGMDGSWGTGGFLPLNFDFVSKDSESFPREGVTLVRIFGEEWKFQAPAAGVAVPDWPTVQGWIQARNGQWGQDEVAAESEIIRNTFGDSLVSGPTATYYPDPTLAVTDGTRFLATGHWVITYQAWIPNRLGEDSLQTITKSLPTQGTVIDGDRAFYRAGNIHYITNRWGDKVSITANYSADGTVATFVIRNEKNTAHAITLTLTTAPADNWAKLRTASIEVDHTLGAAGGQKLPTLRLDGRYFNRRPWWKGKFETWTTRAGDWSGVFLPFSFQETAANSEVRTTRFEWMSFTDTYKADLEDPTATPMIQAITYPDGFKEAFSFLTKSMSIRAWAASAWKSGRWRGFQPTGNPDSAPAYAGVDRAPVSGPGQGIRVFKVLPEIAYVSLTTPPVSAYFAKVDHRTLIYTFDRPVGGLSDLGALPYRLVRLVHYSYPGMNQSLSSPQALLAATNSMAQEEVLHGTGVGTDGTPSSPVTERVVQHSGWDLRSWSNPSGALELVSGPPVATRTAVHADQSPTRTSLAGDLNQAGRDAYGPIRTDEVQAAPAGFPALLAGGEPAVWNETASNPSLSGPLRRVGRITRSFDTALGKLLVQTDQKTLDGASLPDLRFNPEQLPGLAGVGSADFGTTAYTYDGLGRVLTQKGTRGAYTATETREYLGSLPLVTKTLKSLTGPGGPVLAKPGDASVQVGKEVQYGAAPYYWPTAERDLTDGRWTAYQRDELGRETLRTDPLGLQVKTAYDAWGRVASVTRLAKGAVGAVATEYFYDVNGRWKEESATGEGRTLTTRTELDAFGRVAKVSRYQGYGPSRGGAALLDTQETFYDGWGQKTAQTPVLKAGQTPYGNAAWSYDAQGRLTESRDPKGRVLSKVLLQPTWQPQTVEGVTLTGLWTTVQDDRGYTRSEARDLLGQKIAVVDQKGQLTRYWYDQDGRLLKTGQGGQNRWYRYNDMGWLMERFEPEEGSTLFGDHTLLGTPLRVTQSRASGTRSTATLLNGWLLPESVTATGPEGTVTRTLAYSAQHLPMSLSEVQPFGTITEGYAYDELFRVVQKTTSDGTESFTLNRTLDALGSETSLSYPLAGGRAAQTVTRSYDAQNRAKEVKLDGSLRGLMAYDQISGSSVSSLLTYGNGASTKHVTDQGELTRTEHAAPGALLESNLLEWTAGGLMLRRGTDAFQYDALQRLASAATAGLNSGETTTQTFQYDRWGNRTSSAFSYAGPQKPEELLAWTAAYGADNRLPAFVAAAGGSLPTGASYDDLGRMIQVWAVPGQSSSLTSWGYDASGRVLSETVNSKASTFLLDAEGLRFRRRSGSTATYTLYGFGREPLMVFDKPDAGPLTWKKSLVYGHGQLLSEEKPAGTIYIQSDYVGSPNLLTNATGQVVGRTKNLPFGERFGSWGEKSTRRFTNHEDQEGSAIYMQARTYLPAYGKFAQVDPAYDQTKDDPESWNLYNYTTNNPVTKTDPDGRMSGLPYSGPAQVGFSDEPTGLDLALWEAIGFNLEMYQGAGGGCIPTGATKTIGGSSVLMDGKEKKTPTTGGEDDDGQAGAQAVDVKKQTALLLVGDPGLHGHNVGNSFMLAAETEKKGLEAKGWNAKIARISSLEDFNAALKLNKNLNRLYYFGHSSNGALYPGQGAGQGNIDWSNVSGLKRGSLVPGAEIHLMGCRAGMGSYNIALKISDALGRPVFAFSSGTHFTNDPRYKPGIPSRPPDPSRPIFQRPDNGLEATRFY